MIPYGKQEITQDDIESVLETLKSEFITQGPKVEIFEQKIIEELGSNYAVTSNSATSCLHLACKALDLKMNEWVWTSPNSFVASANAALYCGAKIDFVDIDPSTYNMSVSKLEEKLIIAKENNVLPKIVIPVHFAGQSCEMEKIYKLSKKYKFKIIEDASHAIGGTHNGEKIGSCKYSSITVFSFHPVKIITTAEGGVATTNSQKIAEKMKSYRSHGIRRLNKEQSNKISDEIWNYKQESLGFNYRLNDLQSALGLSQLNRLENILERRHKIAENYDNCLADLGIQLPYQDPRNSSSYHLYPIRVSDTKGGVSQKEMYYYLRDNNIFVNLHYIPIYRQPYFKKLGFKKNYCPESEAHFKEVISLPIYPTFSDEEQKYVIEKIRSFLEK